MPRRTRSDSDSDNESSSSSDTTDGASTSSEEGPPYCPFLGWKGPYDPKLWELPESEGSTCSADEDAGVSDDSTDSDDLLAEPRTVFDLVSLSDDEPEQNDEDELWHQLTHNADTPEELGLRAERMRRACQPPPPPTYREALAFLPKPYNYERTFLYSFGDTYAEADNFIRNRLKLPSGVCDVLMADWDIRREEVDFIISVVKDPYIPIHEGLAAPQDDLPAPPPPKRQRRGLSATGQRRMPLIPVSARTGKESAQEKRQLDYQDTVFFIITETRTLAAELGLRPFQLVSHDATPDEVADVYGYSITSKAHGGLIMLRGLRTRWNRTRRFLDAAADNGEVSIQFACQFIDFTKLSGMSNTFKWAAEALGLEVFQQLAASPAITKRQPKRGWAADTAPRVTKQAPWICDEFISFLARRARSLHRTVRTRAIFFYALAVGGVRFSDAQHVVSVEIAGDSVVFVASRFKATKGDNCETFVIPLFDPEGVSLEPAILDLKQQMAAGFLLAHPKDPNNTHSPEHSSEGVSHACSYSAAISLLRTFVREYQTHLSTNNEYIHDDFSKVTMHSLRAWLATLARQVGASPSESNELLHWQQGTMSRLYNRNFEASEVLLRKRVVQVLGSTWRSAGKGHELRTPPKGLW